MLQRLKQALERKANHDAAAEEIQEDCDNKSKEHEKTGEGISTLKTQLVA